MRELDALESLARAESLRIGLISDTHIPEAMPRLWPQVFEAFRGVDCILHAGDIHDLSVIDELSAVAPTYVARGNGDDGSGGRPVQPEDPRLREGWSLELAGLRVGIAHTVPVPPQGGWTLERAMQRYCGRTDLDVMIFGDTHTEWIEHVDGVLCVNPRLPDPAAQPPDPPRHDRLPRDHGAPSAGEHLAAHRPRHRRIRLGKLAPPRLVAQGDAVGAVALVTAVLPAFPG